MPNRCRYIVLLTVVLAVFPGWTMYPEIVTVVGFNARHIKFDALGIPWNQRKKAASEVLRAEDPDMLVLQEASRQQREDLAAALPQLDCAGCDAGFDNLNVIYYRKELLQLQESGTFWLSNTPEEAYSITWGNQEPRFVTWAEFSHRLTGRRFIVYNTHLDHRNQPSRLRSIEAIIADISVRAAGLPLILSGDFNAMPDWPELEMLTGNTTKAPFLPLSDHLAELGADNRVKGTFHSFDGEPDFARIDYILTSWHFRPIEARIITAVAEDGTPPSDHFPIRVTLDLPGPTRP